jgi:hypothetical protein
MLIEIEDESVESIVTAEIKEVLKWPLGIDRKGVKSLLWVLKWYSVHEDWVKYKKSADYQHIKKEFQL